MQRLNKTLASSGVASRRASEELIFSGRVTINGEVVTKPQTLVDPSRDQIKVDGKPVSFERKVYYILNKPAGYLCSAKGKGRLVLDLFEGEKERERCILERYRTIACVPVSDPLILGIDQ